MKVLVTGCASHLARACLPVLLDDPRIHHISGIDLKPSGVSHGKYREHLLDIRSNDIAQHLAGIDAIIHLAFVVNNGNLGKQRFDRDYIRSVNVEGSKHVFELAAKQGVRTIIHLSSAIVYGMAKDNPQFITEDRPLKPVSGFYYAEDKVAVEQWLDQFEQQHAALRVVRFRPHVILGENTQPLVKALLRQPCHFMFNDPQPLTQCVSEVDVATAIMQGLVKDVRGSFNLATDEVASLHLIQQHLRGYSLPLPFALAKQIHQWAWRFTGRFGDPAWLDCLQYSLTIDNEKAKRELDWRPKLNLFECLDAAV
ncbi:MAG: NAD-dependent epimerase/dehydratase family protein [Gammaproteobacteria bacterium]|nr:NAD-dependent epimerase/dehydratase family protein [Gammaproteobacteria bacterium]